MRTLLLSVAALSVVSWGAGPVTDGPRAAPAASEAAVPVAYLAGKHDDGRGDGRVGGSAYPRYTRHSSYPPFSRMGCPGGAGPGCRPDPLASWYRSGRRSYKVRDSTNALKILRQHRGARFSADYPTG